jgi:hypothetical protein
VSAALTRAPKAPWHLWVVGITTLLWNAAGTYTILMAQSGRLPDLEPGEAAYYAAQAWWFVVVTDLALFTACAGAVALLARRRIAVWMFAVSLSAIILTNGYELAAGTSRVLLNNAALIVTIIIVVIAALELAYAWEMNQRSALR